MIVHAGETIWLNPFATVLFNVFSAIHVEGCVLYPCCMGVFGMFAVMLCSSPVSLQILYMDLYDVPLSMPLSGFGMGTRLATVHNVWYNVVL